MGDARDGAGSEGERVTVLVEPGYRGHRMEYVSYAARVLSKSGRRADVAVSPQGRCSEEFSELSISMFNQVAPILVERNTLLGRICDLLRLRRQFKGYRKVFLNVDEYLAPLAVVGFLLGYRHCAGIVMRPRSGVKSYIVGYLERRGMRVLALGSPLDPAGAREMVLDPSGLIPPAPTQESMAFEVRLQAWREAGPALPVVAVVGALDPRKSIDALVDAASAGSLRLVLVGKPSTREYGEALLARIQELPELVAWHRLARVDEATLDVAIAASDWLALLYSNQVGSSGILTRAVRLGTPVMAWGNRTVCDAVRTYRLGSILPAPEIGAIRECLLEPTLLRARTTSHLLLRDVQGSWDRLLVDD